MSEGFRPPGRTNGRYDGRSPPHFPHTVPRRAVHAAPPHTDGMNHTSWEGAALLKPPTGWGMGKPGFPIPLLEGQALPRAGAWGNRVAAPLPASPRWGEEPGSLPRRGRVREGEVSLEGLRPPKPCRGWGNGATGFPHSPAGRGRGETRLPHPPRRRLIFTLGGTGVIPPLLRYHTNLVQQ